MDKNNKREIRCQQNEKHILSENHLWHYPLPLCSPGQSHAEESGRQTGSLTDLYLRRKSLSTNNGKLSNKVSEWL